MLKSHSFHSLYLCLSAFLLSLSFSVALVAKLKLPKLVPSQLKGSKDLKDDHAIECRPLRHPLH